MQQRSEAAASTRTRGDGRVASESLSDEAIVDRVQAGDLALFELIMRRYNQRVFRVVRSILGDDNEAEDVVQEAYVRAYEHLAQFEGRAKFSTWLTRIAVYEATARRRKLRRMRLFDPTDSESLSMPLSSSTDDAFAQTSMGELGTALTRAVDELPAHLRAVFAMRIVEGLDTNETAECLGLTASNVKIRLHRAKTQLRNQIDKQIGMDARRLYQFDGERCNRIVNAVLSRLRRPYSDFTNE